MKKIILLLIVPFVMKAQNPVETPAKEAKETNQKTLTISEKSKNEARKLTESYRQRVIKGEKMSDLAVQYSEDPGSAKNGGRYENIVLGTMVPEFETAAFALKPGEISEVFETQYGFHFIQLIAIHGESRDLRHILIMPK